MEALNRRNPEALAEVLAKDITHYPDGGEIPEAAKRPIEGLDRVARFYVSFTTDERYEDANVRPIRVNGRPALLVVEDASALVMAFRVANDQIQEVYTIMNPEKLEHLRPERFE